MSDEIKKMLAAIEAQKRIAAKQEIVSQEEKLSVRGQPKREAEQSNQNSEPAPSK
ncbi:unnamed protein product [marine sediment metagenome]|uniref:Uncharacterized protein n=1 Tax=marine sediment metagenome TaxID=412755 RepID=X0V0D9_9ZZZZ